jgi:acetolactate synthase-1/3 small subunit
MKIEKPGDVEGALREAFAQKERLVFLDFITDEQGERVPMIPGGKGLTEMIWRRSCEGRRAVAACRRETAMSTSCPSSSRTNPVRCRACRDFLRARLQHRVSHRRSDRRHDDVAMTIVTAGSDDVIEQITKHLNKLIEVVKVVDLTEGNHIERELMLVQGRASGKEREEMKRLADIFRGRILDVTDKSYTVELTGTGDKLDAFIQAIEPGAILETVRTGASGIGRGDAILKSDHNEKEHEMKVYYEKDATCR